MNLEPERLECRVIVRRELMRLEYTVQLAILSSSERDDRARLENALALLDLLRHRQGPQEPRQPLHVARALQNLADTRDLHNINSNNSFHKDRPTTRKILEREGLKTPKFQNFSSNLKLAVYRVLPFQIFMMAVFFYFVCVKMRPYGQTFLFQKFPRWDIGTGVRGIVNEDVERLPNWAYLNRHNSSADCMVSLKFGMQVPCWQIKMNITLKVSLMLQTIEYYENSL